MTSSNYLTISCSMDPNSCGFTLGQFAHDQLRRRGGQCDFIDLRDYELTLSNGTEQSAYHNPQVDELHDRILDAQGIIMVVPIYNYHVNSACKNLIELTGTPFGDRSGAAWKHKVIGLIAMAGGEASYMAPLSLLNGLMLDYRAVIIPRYVYALRSHFEKGRTCAEAEARVVQLVDTISLFVQGLAPYIGEGSEKR